MKNTFLNLKVCKMYTNNTFSNYVTRQILKILITAFVALLKRINQVIGFKKGMKKIHVFYVHPLI